MSRINAAIVFGIRKQLALYREQLATGNPGAVQLLAIREKLIQLRQRIEPLIAERRWEAQEVNRELDQLARQVHDRMQGRLQGRDSGQYAHMDRIGVQLDAADHYVMGVDQLANQHIDHVRASRMILQPINITQDRRYWFPLNTGSNNLVPITVNLHRQDVSGTCLGSENICHQDGGQWFSYFGLPRPLSQTSRQALVQHRANEIEDHVPNYLLRTTRRPKPMFLWFSRLPAAAAGGHQYRYQCYLNRDEPWTNFGRLQQSAPVWYIDGPVVQVGILEEYDQLVESVNRLADYCLPRVAQLNERLANIDLEWRIQRQQLPVGSNQRQQLEQRYREVMARLLAVRDRLRDEYQTLNDSAQQQLRLFSTPGAGGLLICKYL